MKINIACCDDRKEQIIMFKELFANYEIQNDVDINVEYFLSGVFLLQSIEEGKKYDIVFLDMEMPTLGGIEVAKMIREKCGRNVIIIFVTNFPDYMQQSFDVRAFHYIIKPVKYPIFERILKSAVDELLDEEEIIRVFETVNEEVIVLVKDIVYIEKEKGERYLLLHTTKETIKIKGTINAIEKSLNCNHFLRVHRNVLINMQHIKVIRKLEIVMRNGSTILVSRRKETELKEKFWKYIIQESKR